MLSLLINISFFIKYIFFIINTRYQVQKVISNAKSFNGTVLNNYTYEQIKNCVIMHDEAIQFVFIKLTIKYTFQIIVITNSFIALNFEVL